MIQHILNTNNNNINNHISITGKTTKTIMTIIAIVPARSISCTRSLKGLLRYLSDLIIFISNYNIYKVYVGQSYL